MISKKIVIAMGMAASISGCYSQAPKLEPYEAPKELNKSFVAEVPRVDILFVVDDSGSMETYQKILSSNIDLFINEFGKNSTIDYHIGVVTTSADNFGRSPVTCQGGTKTDGCLIGDPAFIDANTPGGYSLIKNRIMVGTSGSATERIFDPIISALSAPNTTGWNQGFIRPRAYLALIFITDAEDQSETKEADFISFLKNLKSGNQSKVLTYGALVSKEDFSTGCTQDSGKPDKLERIINTFGGTFYSLCDPDYGPKLAAIGKDLTVRVTSTVYLEQLPRIETLKVEFGSSVIPNDPEFGWTYVPKINAVVFGKKVNWEAQPDDTQIRVKFEPIEL